jgi:hypothetical protein
MQYNHKNIFLIMAVMLAFTACKKDGNPNNLPDVSAAAYEGKIDGFSSSDEVFPDNILAYWSFDDTKNEAKTGAGPTESLNDTYVTGVRGKAINLAAGYLYYARQFANFRTDTLRNWSISTWVRIANNGSRRTMVFQLARPNLLTGNINFILNTQSYPATNDSTLRLNPTFATIGGGTQDNLNNVLDRVRLNNWVHIVLTYDFATGVFNNWINGVRVGNFPNRGTGNNNFRSNEPSEVIFGTNYNNIPGKTVNTDASFNRMSGQIDEVRIYNRPLPDAFIRALYNLGIAGK